MNSTLLCVALVSTLAIGCGRAPVTARAPSPAPAKIASIAAIAAIEPIEEKASEPAGASAPADPAKAPARAVGDFIVHRFSGSFRDAPLTLTQRIIAREGDVLVIDMTLEEGSSRRTLRVRMDDSPEKRGEVVRVSRMVEGLEKEASIEQF
ncbi:MAG TPA: hypothetical protein VK459_17020, partial [Polyangiaceae bacterium]|nr:hypothetical protein [Polyangiaceae bacterium]